MKKTKYYKERMRYYEAETHRDLMIQFGIEPGLRNIKNAEDIINTVSFLITEIAKLKTQINVSNSVKFITGDE